MDPKREEEILGFWEKKGIPAKARKKKGKKFFFMDGPPYATGSIHVGTAWNKILKDAYIRFWRMSGFSVWDQPGYDTHGLPIENKVEKQLQIRSKADIERLGIEAFIKECRQYATKFIGTMNTQFKNLGVWMDWDNPYVTLDNSYIEGAWHTFKVAYDKGFLYRGLYPVHVCPHCETAVAYNEIIYTTVSDPSIYVKLKVKNANEYLVIWTTTPWTLPANTGVMAKPDADYVRVNVNGEVLVLAEALLEQLMQKTGASYSILEKFKGKDLEGMEYEHPLSDIFLFQRPVKHRVVLSDQYVTLDAGTGLVHTAPGHGQEDYKVGTENGLPILSPVNMNGTFNDQCGALSGIFVKKADRIIIDNLRERNALLHEEKISHEYPQCWRCNSPLLFMSVTQWFFRVTKIRDKLLAENKKVKWYPKWAGQRFENWLESLGDWPISRQRYWGIPLPIWVCESCNFVKVIESVKELGKKLNDLHRPYIDSVVLKCRCGGDMRRVQDVLDVWFDSGLASWSSLGYPASKKLFSNMWPADLNIEGPDQIRGWWNSQLITSVITFGVAPFRSILFHGFVLDAHGDKMAKSLGNVVAPEEVVQKHGRDVLRTYFLASPPWDDFYFKWNDVEAVAKSLVVMENTFNFVKTYGQKVNGKPELLPEDRWILSRLHSLVERTTRHFSSYNIHRAVTEINDFVVIDFSRWYIKLIRDRVWPAYDGKDKEAAFFAMLECSAVLSRLMTPVVPFLAEHVHQDVCIPFGAKGISVHLLDWPKPNRKYIDAKLESRMKIAEEITETVNAVRKENGLKLRWPLEKIIVETKDKEAAKAVDDLEAVIRYMTNVKRVETGQGESGLAEKEFSKGRVYVSKNVLKDEALLRELLREIQSRRKQHKLVVKDRIMLRIDNESMKKYVKEIKEKVGAKEITFGSVEKEFGKVEVDGAVARFKFSLAK